MLRNSTAQNINDEVPSGLFFSSKIGLPPTEQTIEKNHEHKNGSVCLKEIQKDGEAKKVKTLTVHHCDKDKITQLISDLRAIDKDIITFFYPEHYRQPRVTINMSCSQESRKAVWELINDRLGDLHIPKEIQSSSYSRPTSPCTSPMSSPRVRVKA